MFDLELHENNPIIKALTQAGIIQLELSIEYWNAIEKSEVEGIPDYQLN